MKVNCISILLLFDGTYGCNMALRMVSNSLREPQKHRMKDFPTMSSNYDLKALHGAFRMIVERCSMWEFWTGSPVSSSFS